MHQPSVLPIHDGGGDGPRPPSQSLTSRAIKARKAAQMEYRAQLDLLNCPSEVTQRTRKKSELNGKKSECANARNYPINIIPVSVPISGPIVKQLGTPSPEATRITFASFPILSSKSLPKCVSPQPTTTSESLTHAQIFGRSNPKTVEENQSLPAVASYSSPQIPKSNHSVTCLKDLTPPPPATSSNQHEILIVPPPPQFTSTPISIPRNQLNVTRRESECSAQLWQFSKLSRKFPAKSTVFVLHLESM